MSKHIDLKRYTESVLAEANAWYEKIMLSLVFEEEGAIDPSFLKDDYFRGLLSHLKADEKAEMADTLSESFSELRKSLHPLSTISEQKDQDTKKKYVRSFMESHDRFILHVRSCLEHEGAQSYTDSETGLRKIVFLEEDYKKEMDRFKRDGHSFCFCLIRSDEIWNKETQDPVHTLQTISKAVLSNLRLFDDAYHIDGSYILVSLKHTDTSGSVKFFERIQRYFESMDLSITITACITELALGQALDGVIEDMKKDLKEECKDVRDDYIIMSEATDLQKFLNNGQ